MVEVCIKRLFMNLNILHEKVFSTVVVVAHTHTRIQTMREEKKESKLAFYPFAMISQQPMYIYKYIIISAPNINVQSIVTIIMAQALPLHGARVCVWLCDGSRTAAIKCRLQLIENIPLLMGTISILFGIRWPFVRMVVR